MRNDRELQQDIADELDWEPGVPSAHIGVEVDEGIVTLTGHVDSYTQKCAAEQAALRVLGVKGVVLKIEVELPYERRRTDKDLVRAVCHALEWHGAIPADRIRPSVQSGWVKLSGEVESADQRWAALAAVRDIVGVAGIHNCIEIKPHAPPAPVQEIKRMIEAALRRHAHVDAHAIKVELDDDEVVLSGPIDSHAERIAICDAAWRAPGVRNVVDAMWVTLPSMYPRLTTKRMEVG
jgi:osmotically-inducible protein OsmY